MFGNDSRFSAIGVQAVLQLLLRNYLPKGTDVSGFTQNDLNAIAWKLNNRASNIQRSERL